MDSALMMKQQRSVVEIVLSDPKQLLTMLQAGLGLGVAFGLSVTAEQMGAIVAFLSAFIVWLNSQQPTPHDLDALTKAADATVRAKNLELDEVKKQAAAVIEAEKS